tara:strand:- start:106 stop:381 length:276 start_codon:yes stop_codon:yes gene_type:complete
MEVNVKMDFLEDLDLYNRAMENAYLLITGKKTLSDLLINDVVDIPLPFDPEHEDGKSSDILDILIVYYEEMEEYEKCSELIDLKKNATKYK